MSAGMFASIVIIVFAVWICWGIYALMRDREDRRKAKAKRERMERIRTIQDELDTTRIKTYWRDRGERIRPIATRCCSEIDENT